MAKTKISEYDSTAANNTDIDGINIDEGCAPSGINNAIREMMAQLKNFQAGTSGDTLPVTAGGTGSGTASGARTNLGLGSIATQDATSVNIDGGAIDGTPIGANSASTGAFTTATATTGNITTVNATTVDSTNVEVTNLKAKDGTAAATIADSTGVITIPSSVLTTTDINGGAIDGTPIGSSSASTGAFTSITGTSGVISANSSSDALRITQTGSGKALVVEDSANPDSTPFVVNQAGNVIVGGATELFLPGVVPSFQIEGTGNSASSVYARYSADFEPPRFFTFKSRNATVGSHTIVNNNDLLSEQRFYGSDGTQFVQAAQIAAAVDGTPGTNDMPGRLVFATTPDGGSTPVERMRIDNQGRVGIGGTPNSSARFSIVGNIPSVVDSYSIANLSNVTPSTTGIAGGVLSQMNTGESFTLSQMRLFAAGQGTVGSGSTVTNQYGYFAEALTGATNNYGFYSNIASGTGRWNFYAAGSAANYFAGNTGIGATSPGTRLDISGSWVSGVGTMRINGSSGQQYSGFTVSNNGSVRTYFYDDNTNNYTFIGATTGKALVFATNSGGTDGERLRLKTTGQTRFVPLASDPAGAEAGDVYYNSATNKLKVYNGTSWVDLH